MSIFVKSISLIKATEAYLVSETDSNIPLFSYFKRLIWLPAKFLKMGISEKTKGASAWLFLTFTFIMLGAWLINNAGIAKTETANMIMLAAMIIPIFLVTFAMPSIYGNSGVTQKTIAFVILRLQEQDVTKIKDVELIKKSVYLLEARSRSRVTVLKGVVGLLWAGLIFSSTKGFEQSMVSPNAFMSFAFMLASLLMCVIVAYLCVWGYEAALDKLFRAIEFGCNDMCHLIDIDKP